MTYIDDDKLVWITIHYSASPIEREYPYWQLEADHMKRGFRSAGYHFYLPRKGGIISGRRLDQPGRFEQGAHSQGENDRAIGICYEGGVTLLDPDTGFDSRTPEQTAFMIETIDRLLLRYPNAEVRGHRDMPGAATQCPGFDAGAWWRGIKAEREKPWWMRFLQAFIRKESR